MGPKILAAGMIITGVLLIIFPRRLARFTKETDDQIFAGKSNPFSVLNNPGCFRLSGIGLIIYGLFLLLKF